MSAIELPAIEGASPLGFLAGLGVLRIAADRAALGEVRLAWQQPPPHHAIAVCSAAISAEKFVAEISKGLLNDPSRSWPESVIKGAKLKKLPVKKFRTQAARLAKPALETLAALCTDASDDETAGCSPLVMTGGPQDFPVETRKLRQEVRADAGRLVKEALLGPSRYCKGHPLGFDPQMELVHAYLAAKPEGDAHRVPAAVLLAVAGMRLLPLYPADYRIRFNAPAFKDRRRARGEKRKDKRKIRFTAATFKDRRHAFMRWPLWSQPLSPAAVMSLLAVYDDRRWTGTAETPADLFAGYESERFRVGTQGGYFVLRAGRRLF